MNLIFRMLWVLISSFFKPRLATVFDTSILKFHVLPNDLDTNFHMNNGRYLTLMDLGRFDLVLRNGLLTFMRAHRSVPILGAATIRYRLPLNPWRPFTIETRVLGWDEKWFYMEQRFILQNGSRKGAVAAIAIVKGGFYDKNKKTTVPTQEVAEHLGVSEGSPKLPQHVLEWIESEKHLQAVTAKA